MRTRSILAATRARDGELPAILVMRVLLRFLFSSGRFHGTCVDITEQESALIASYECEACCTARGAPYTVRALINVSEALQCIQSSLFLCFCFVLVWLGNSVILPVCLGACREKRSYLAA